jgi:FixJ family two-component response regulator
MDMGGVLGTTWLGAHSDLNHAYHKLNNRWLFMTVLLLTDVALPGRSGLDLARDMSRQNPSLAVVVVSGWIPEDSPSLEPGWVCITKPFAPQRLSEAIREVLDVRSDQRGSSS